MSTKFALSPMRLLINAAVGSAMVVWWWSAEQVRPDEFSRLIEAPLADHGDDERGTMHVVYAQDTTRAHALGWYPENVLAVTVCDGWACGLLS
jgi:hypothetical protein